MTFILESILDNIDTSDSNAANRLSANADVAPEDLFDYILYIGHQTRNRGTSKERQEELRTSYDMRLERFKEKLNLCVESYYTDDIVYFEEEEDFIEYLGKKRLSEEEQKNIKSAIGGMGVYKIYFNFTRRIDDMLQFFYIVANDFQTWGSHSIERIFDTKNQSVACPIGFFDRNFLPQFRWDAEKTKLCGEVIIEKFWDNRRILNLPTDSEERTTYVDNRIEQFVKKIRNRDEKRKEQEG